MKYANFSLSVNLLKPHDLFVDKQFVAMVENAIQ
jgi:hypothetical protein